MATKFVESEITGTDQYSDSIAVVKGSALHYTITNDVGVTAFLVKVEESFDGGATWQQVYKSNGDEVEFSAEISASTGTMQYTQDTLFRFGIPSGGTFMGTGNIYITLRAG